MSKEVCVPAIKLTKERLLEERGIIDDKIKALDIVLEMFDEVDPEEIIKTVVKPALTEEEKKLKKKEYMKNYWARKKEKNPDAVALGRLGGLKGGKARNEKLSAEEKIDIARKGAEARWGNKSSEVEVLKDTVEKGSSVQRKKKNRINYEDMA